MSDLDLNIHVGPIFGQVTQPVLYALDSDESYMQRPKKNWTKRDIEVDEMYAKNNTAFIFSLICTTKPSDCFILPSEFQDIKENELLKWHLAMYKKIGLTPTSNFVFSDLKEFARKAGILVRESKYPAVVTTCYSHLTSETFSIPEQLNASKHVNAKEFLLEQAEKLGLSVPKSLIIHSELDIQPDRVATIDFPEHPAFFKASGLGGGNNVVEVTKIDEIFKLVDSGLYDPPYILQKKIDPTYDEIIISCLIFPDRVQLTSNRYKMTDQNIWYGNIFDPKLRIDSSVEKQAVSLAGEARKLGYSDQFGLYFGVDAFHHSTTNIAVLTEVNARYLGSTPVELFLSKLALLGNTLVVSMFDYVSESELARYQEFTEKHLYKPNVDNNFSLIPLSFSAFQETDGSRLVYYLILGDIEFFTTVVNQEFSKDSFVMARKAVEKYSHILKN